MYKTHFGFREKPFSILPDASFLYLGEKHALAIDLLEYGVANDVAITVITGGIGCGKTTLIQFLLKHMDRDINVGLIANTHASFGELSRWVLSSFSLDHRNRDKIERHRILTEFLVNEHQKNRRTVLIVDEAQNLGVDTIEELRMLSNLNAGKRQIIQLILVGQPQLREILDRPELVQFAQRVGAHYHLEALNCDETGEYIRHRVSVAGGDPELFEPDSFAVLYQHTQGIPRTINALCDSILLYAFAGGLNQIKAELVEEVVEDRARRGLFGLRNEEPNAKHDHSISAEQGHGLDVCGVAQVSSELHQPHDQVAVKHRNGGDTSSGLLQDQPAVVQQHPATSSKTVRPLGWKEKRTHARASVNAITWVRNLSMSATSGPRFLQNTFTLADLSLRGARLMGSDPLGSVRDKLELVLPTDSGKNAYVRGRIVRVEHQEHTHTTAVHFTHASVPDQLSLSKVVSILLGHPSNGTQVQSGPTTS
ncbi:MAG: AAA family ATPase [Gammaproteobacteria bacterium]|nr:AAA family ATPase [Gammaproteobacteria bacterium]